MEFCLPALEKIYLASALSFSPFHSGGKYVVCPLQGWQNWIGSLNPDLLQEKKQNIAAPTYIIPSLAILWLETGRVGHAGNSQHLLYFLFSLKGHLKAGKWQVRFRFFLKGSKQGKKWSEWVRMQTQIIGTWCVQSRLEGSSSRLKGRGTQICHSPNYLLPTQTSLFMAGLTLVHLKVPPWHVFHFLKPGLSLLLGPRSFKENLCHISACLPILHEEKRVQHKR